MSADCSYVCLTIEVERPLPFKDKDGEDGRILLCKFRCENEHGHKMATARGVVWYGDGHADIEDYADNVLADDAPEEDLDELQRVMDNENPPYHFYNPEEVAEMLHRQTNPDPVTKALVERVLNQDELTDRLLAACGQLLTCQYGIAALPATPQKTEFIAAYGALRALRPKKT